MGGETSMTMTSGPAREWLGKRLGRRGPVSEKTWRRLRLEGLPVIRIGNTLLCTEEGLEAWLTSAANNPTLVAPPSQPPQETGLKRKPGRPRKYPISA